ncbi:hypothetical protein XA68_11975 [Ophiocordyceps unilateralis]|uniref:Uncharacterized protein n=1 Tax=Ophiocordyceps unilateralis TaxID=268505 RepID=A0A2A9PFL7_OPHUN|nr:hypothetical protein XA68_11975 [Ophiocordyceps unilateralis]
MRAMTSNLHCTHLLFLAHTRNARRTRHAPAIAHSNKTPHQGRDETGPSEASTSHSSVAAPYPDYIADGGELERRRLGEAQPQLVPAEMIRDRSKQFLRGRARGSRVRELEEAGGVVGRRNGSPFSVPENVVRYCRRVLETSLIT